MKRVVILLLIFLILIIFIGSFFWFFSKKKQKGIEGSLLTPTPTKEESLEVSEERNQIKGVVKSINFEKREIRLETSEGEKIVYCDSETEFLVSSNFNGQNTTLSLGKDALEKLLVFDNIFLICKDKLCKNATKIIIIRGRR